MSHKPGRTPEDAVKYKQAVENNTQLLYYKNICTDFPGYATDMANLLDNIRFIGTN